MSKELAEQIAEAVCQYAGVDLGPDLVTTIQPFLIGMDHLEISQRITKAALQIEHFKMELQELRKRVDSLVELEAFDVGLLASFETVAGWHGYIRCLLDDAHRFYQQQVDALNTTEDEEEYNGN